MAEPKNLRFRPLLPLYLEWARQLHNDPDVLSMLTDPHIVSMNEQDEWYENLQKSNTSLRWMVFNYSNPIGIVRLDQIDKDNKSICVGLDIHKDYRGQGYAKLIYKQLFYEWFNEHEFNRIWLMVASYNTVAINLYTQLGFTTEGVQREALYKDGQFYDYIMMFILRSEYDSLI